MFVVACGLGITASPWFRSLPSSAPALRDAPHTLSTQRARTSDAVACPSRQGSKPPVLLLALGQSNAGNHGETRADSAFGVLWAEGNCYRIVDPLPGGTGSGGSIWSRLASILGTQKLRNELIVSVLAVDATQAVNWVQPGPISTELTRTADALRSQRLTVSAVLWQQGEADARAATSKEDYSAALTILIDRLRAVGISGPVLLARSTRCRAPSSAVVRDATARVVETEPNVYLGPDTDALGDEFRFDGCHFNDAGLQRAALMWLDALRQRGVIAAN